MDKKFLIITNHSYMLWQFRRDLIGELLKRGEVVLSMPFVGHEEDFKAMGCRCIETQLDRRGINPAAEQKLYRTYKELILKEKPDHVITYSIKPNVYAGKICKKLGIPYSVNVQGMGTAFQKKGIAQAATMLYRSALKDANTVFFENTEIAKEFLRRRILTQDKVTVLSGAGVNVDYFTKEPYPEEDEGIRFLFLGRIMKEKGVDEFFEASRRMKEKYRDRVQFGLVGFFEEDYKDTVENLTADGIEKFFGFQTDPRPWYKAAHCVVQPSYHEGMNNVLLEAAATGRPVITTDIPGCREAVEDGKTGFLCRKQDTDDLTSCMEKFIAMTREQREQMGRSGRELVEEKFNRQSVVEKTLEALGVNVGFQP